ncbi:MAG TPA: hypothetical protein PKE32_08330 [Miltoncostaeaceae bacterium]|nr:hypothetical protein [Miltoncostaeaceae bacterium]
METDTSVLDALEALERAQRPVERAAESTEPEMRVGADGTEDDTER